MDYRSKDEPVYLLSYFKGTSFFCYFYFFLGDPNPDYRCLNLPPVGGLAEKPKANARKLATSSNLTTLIIRRFSLIMVCLYIAIIAY